MGHLRRAPPRKRACRSPAGGQTAKKRSSAPRTAIISPFRSRLYLKPNVKPGRMELPEGSLAFREPCRWPAPRVRRDTRGCGSRRCSLPRSSPPPCGPRRGRRLQSHPGSAVDIGAFTQSVQFDGPSLDFRRFLPQESIVKYRKNLVRSAVLMLLATALAMAQSDRGTITGTVLDPANSVVPGAKLVLRNTETGAMSETQATVTGNFTLPSLPVGVYDLSVESPGFKKAVQKSLQVQVDQTLRLDIKLEVGATSDSVTVTADAPLLRTENAEQSMNVRGDKVNDLPLNFGGGGSAGGGIRNWLSFIILAPGVSGTSYNSPINGIPTGTYGNFKVYLEGQDSTSINDANWTSSVAAASVETITEFAVQSSNFSPEFGQVAGGYFNFTTKSGTNQIHGSAYEQWANEALDAAHPFSHLTDRDRKNDYGFTVGGPVWIPRLYNGRNKTFFFFGEERFANNQLSVSSYSTVPTAAYRLGDFSAALTGKTLTDPTSGMQFAEKAID